MRQHLTRTGVVVGTPAYMAPEQARNPNVDFRADLFSLGVVLYQMLAGKLPFRGHDALSTLMSICSDIPEPPTKFVKDLPVAMNNLVMKLLAKEADQRFQSAQEVCQAIEAINLKHFGGRALRTSELKTQPSLDALVARPVTPATLSSATVAEPSPFSFRRKRDKLVSLSSSSELTLPGPPPKPTPPKSPDRRWPWMLVAAGLMGVVVLVVTLAVIRMRDDAGQPVAAVVEPKKGKVAVVDKKEPAAELPEPVAEVEDPFPQFDRHRCRHGSCRKMRRSRPWRRSMLGTRRSIRRNGRSI